MKNNQKILKDRWEEVDNSLASFLVEYRKENQLTRNELQDLINTIGITSSELNKRIPKDLKARFKSQLKIWKTLKKTTGYFGYIVNKMESKSSITYKEYLETSMMGIYNTEYNNLDGSYTTLFDEVAKNSYSKAVTDMKLTKFVKYRKQTYRNIMQFEILDSGVDEYLASYYENCSNQFYKRVIQDLTNESLIELNNKVYTELFKKQEDSLIMFKKYDKGATVKFANPSGLLANLTDCITNRAYAVAGEENNVQYCRFIAVEDEHTTKMCKSMNNMIFAVNGTNKFKRYSESAGGLKEYEVDGLVLGINLPPIMDHFHWCRSTITYLVNDIAEQEYVRNKQKNNNKAH